MSPSSHRCAAHGNPAHDATLCGRCVTELERHLAEIPALLTDLDITLSRQAAVTLHDGGRSAEHPLPYHPAASVERDNLHGTLAGWVRDLHDRLEVWPADDTAALARWLQSRLDRIRTHPAGDEIHDEVGYAVRAARAVTDRPRDRSRVFVAACLDDACVGELWALIPLADYDAHDPATHAAITCTGCEATYPAVEWIRLGTRILRRTA